MGDLVFALLRHGGEGLPFLGHIKYRVVAEAALAVIFPENHAPADATNGKFGAVRINTGDGRNKFTLAPAYAFIVKFIDPIAIGAIIVAGMVFGMAIS